MINRFRVLFSLAIYFLFAGNAQAVDNVFMWKAVSPEGEIHLLGSIHVGDDSFYPLDPAIEKAFEQSSALVVEVDITDQDLAALQQVVMQKGFCAPGDSLDKHISPEAQKAVASYLDGADPAIQMVRRMKPWAVYLVLEEIGMKKMGLDPAKGIDNHFLNKANENGKKISELESMEYQLDLISGFDDRLQESLIMMAVTDIDKRRDDVASIIYAWKSGNAPLLESLVFSSLKKNPELEPVYEKMFFHRNKVMANNIAQMALSGDKLFVVVGAGHLVGEKGVVRLLREKGFAITQAASAR
ncbi:MAG: TraB/GumN family protein [Nitrospinota bacterium]|nr:TraB/GumN family protein [Nitrospinota bacterium]